MVSVVKERRKMKRFDVEKAIEFAKNIHTNVADSIWIASVVECILKAGIVDEAEKVDPDPIIEVWKKYRFRITPEMLRGEGFRSEMWQAIEKYAEGKGKK
jgi:hypothetical protein